MASPMLKTSPQMLATYCPALIFVSNLMNGISPNSKAALLATMSDYQVTTQGVQVVAPDDRRVTPRQRWTAPLVVIPIMPDHRPGNLQWADATSVDISASGLGFIVGNQTPVESDRVVIGADVASGRAFATLRIESKVPTDDGRYRIGGSWQLGTVDDILAEYKLRPRVNAESMTFEFGWPNELLLAWSEVGVLRQYLVDRMLVCNQCHAIPSWRMGCKVCGSGRIHREQSKTNQRAAMQIECFDCGSRNCSSAMSGMCHICNHRFDTKIAVEQLVYAFHVERLNPVTMMSI